MTGSSSVRVVALIGVLWLCGCALTPEIQLGKAEIAGLRITGVDILYAPNANFWWGRGDQEYVAKVVRSRNGGKPLPPDTRPSDYDALIASPGAKAFMQSMLTPMLKDRLQRKVIPRFQGSRPVRLVITVTGIMIPSQIHSFTFGGGPQISSKIVLKDATTGAELGRMDKFSVGRGYNVFVAAVTPGTEELEQRILDKHCDDILEWLQQG